MVATTLPTAHVPEPNSSRSPGLKFERSGSGVELVHSKKLAGSKQPVTQSRTPDMIKGSDLRLTETDSCLTVFGQNSKNRVVGNIVVVEQIGTVARHEDLRVPGGVSKSIDENPGRRGMERSLRLFDTHEPALRVSASSTLEEGQKHAECTQGAVRHIARQESPGVLGSTDFLSKFECLSGADSPPIDLDQPGERPPRDTPRSSAWKQVNVFRGWKAYSPRCFRPVSGDRPDRAAEGPESLRDSDCRNPCLTVHHIQGERNRPRKR